MQRVKFRMDRQHAVQQLPMGREWKNKAGFRKESMSLLHTQMIPQKYIAGNSIGKSVLLLTSIPSFLSKSSL